MESAVKYKKSYDDGQSVPDSFKASVFYIQDNMEKNFNGFIAYTMPDFDFAEKISKTDSNGNHLSGAKMQILQNSKVIDSWTSDDSDHIAHLKKGDYILHETEAPAGYQQAADIRFSVDEEGNLTINGEEENNVSMIDQVGNYLPVTGKYGNAETDAVGMAVMGVALISFARKTGKFRRKSENNKLIKNK